MQTVGFSIKIAEHDPINPVAIKGLPPLFTVDAGVDDLQVVHPVLDLHQTLAPLPQVPFPADDGL